MQELTASIKSLLDRIRLHLQKILEKTPVMDDATRKVNKCSFIHFIYFSLQAIVLGEGRDGQMNQFILVSGFIITFFLLPFRREVGSPFPFPSLHCHQHRLSSRPRLTGCHRFRLHSGLVSLADKKGRKGKNCSHSCDTKESSWRNGCTPGVATLDADIHGQGSTTHESLAERFL